MHSRFIAVKPFVYSPVLLEDWIGNVVPIIDNFGLVPIDTCSEDSSVDQIVGGESVEIDIDSAEVLVPAVVSVFIVVEQFTS